MRHFIICILAVMTAANVEAQKTMRQLWVDMPDTIVPYLNNTKRTEMVDFYDMGVRAETTNRLASVTVLDTLSSNFAGITLNEAASMQLALLLSDSGDSILCMVRTFKGEAPESSISFYDTKWQPQETSNFIDCINTKQLMEKPDTMDVDAYDRLTALIDPVMVEAVFLPEENAIAFQLSTPLVTREERQRLETILKQRKVKWNGKRFN
ncbi:MAG: DUF3256 family protein [Prevotella sp.]|nr:DUF3256 family protein [Prevotella sp.]